MSAVDRPTLLLVDDGSGLEHLLQARFQQSGILVIPMHSAEDGLRRALRGGIDLMVVDERLPNGASGLELFRKIKAAEQDVPTILVTAFSDESLVLQALRAGVIDFIPKTANYLDYLVAAIERALKEKRTERHLASIINSAMEAVLTINDEQRVTLFNPAAEQLFACSAAEAVGQAVGGFLPAWEKLLRDGSPIESSSGLQLCRVETEGIRSGGVRFPLEVSLARARNLTFWTCLARDITDRRRVQQEHLRLIQEQAARAEAERSEDRLLEYVTELRRLQEVLHQSDRRKDEFLATLAHELRNPLAPILNALHIMRLAQDDRAAVEDARSIIERQVRHMVRLIDDLLDLSRITRGKIQLRMQPVELAQIIHSAVESSRPAIDAAGHMVELAVPAEPVVFMADPTRLAQVLLNLLNNAAKYTEPGGSIWVAAATDGDDLVISVRDSGIGIAAEILPTIFEMFAQADRAVERSQGGLGIGLSLVRGLVGLHDGTVTAHSPGPGQGSEFVVRLPVARVEPAEAAPGPLAGARPTPARRVLLLDDNVDGVRSLETLLKLLGHQVAATHNGQDCLEKARTFKPEIVVLDIGLPGMNGYEVGRRLRQIPGLHKVPLVALTGWGKEEDRRKSMEAGFSAHLVKPVELPDLEALLANAVF
jgi:PAS domain S-box-containing protein